MNGHHHLSLLGLEIFQSMLRTWATKVDIMLVFRQLQQHAVDV
jgi:hypothetical protein